MVYGIHIYCCQFMVYISLVYLSEIGNLACCVFIVVLGLCGLCTLMSFRRSWNLTVAIILCHHEQIPYSSALTLKNLNAENLIYFNSKCIQLMCSPLLFHFLFHLVNGKCPSLLAVADS